MKKKEKLWPKLIFPIFLIVTFSVVYVFGPKYTGFHVYEGSGVSNNLLLIFVLMFVFVLMFIVLKEAVFKLK
ncbi:MAG: hypothetical protein KAT77_04125 [Nanoarchaeota archaeon]|nr:hypothetical protein [Nanoarchaeota archaeon]